jgi:GT2 family glycosyltransferase
MPSVSETASAGEPTRPSPLPYFSVIVPTYNRPSQLAMCAEALGSLDYPRDRCEVIIVDDGSNTSLESAVGPLRRRIDVTLICQHRSGPAAARNAGARLAKGTFLAFTDDDCKPAADWLEKLAAHFAATPGHIVGGRTVNALSANPYSAVSQLIQDVAYSHYNKDPGHARFFASNNLAVPAQRFQALGGFDPTFSTSEDRDLCDRWLYHGHTMTYAPQAIVHHFHALTLASFWRQHFRYGCGAFRFHRMRARRGSGRFRPDIRFYLKVLREGFRRHQHRALVPSILLVWWLANATGFFWEMRELTAGAKPAGAADR